jgi:anaerobic selenocysteine-containing dehydrogenase
LVETFSTLFAPALLPPMGDRRPAWWILSQLARRLGCDLLDGRDPDALDEDAFLFELARNGRSDVESLVAAGGGGIAAPPLYGWVREKALPSGRWRLMPPGLAELLPSLREDLQSRGRSAEELLLICGRQLTRVNATRYVPERKSRDLPRLRMHPDDAEARQLRSGDRVVIRSDYGEVAAVMTADEVVRRGVVWMPHGWLEANVGHLTSANQRIDPLTGQPEMTGLVVTVVGARA